MNGQTKLAGRCCGPLPAAANRRFHVDELLCFYHVRRLPTGPEESAVTDTDDMAERVLSQQVDRNGAEPPSISTIADARPCRRVQIETANDASYSFIKSDDEWRPMQGTDLDARVEFYEGCDPEPDAEPFFTTSMSGRSGTEAREKGDKTVEELADGANEKGV